MEDLTVMRTIQ